MNRIFATASAALLALALTAPALTAQDLGLKQLQDSAVSNMAKLGMDTSMVEVLTLDELAQIQAITNSGESEQSQKGRLDTVLRTAEERIATGGAVVPTGPAGDIQASDLEGIDDVRHSVRAEIAELGLNTEVDVDKLTNDQLMQVNLTLQQSANESEKKMKVRELLQIN
ncbi:hypothetical protein CNY89_05355 [Amaricoccus sp. HAR-UPW-R2A-40]|nr:hypothetical protein CNY89_05355 [Amaricoccus sp. HAR-UPW-R2A-40]